MCYFSADQLDYDYDVLNHEACSRICDEWIILVQCSRFSIVRHLEDGHLGPKHVVSKVKVNVKERRNSLLHC
jgi:hypothetical protein